jgi:AraC-like DNA-binding protein
MKAIFLIGSVQALFFSLLVFNKKEKYISDKILGVWLLIFAVQLIFPFLVYGDYKKFIHLAGADMSLLPLHAALLFVYTRALMSKQNKFRKRWLLNFIPSVIVFISSIPYLIISREEKILMYENKMEYPGSIFVMSMFMLSFVVFYLVRTFQFLNRHKNNIHQEYSFEENIDLKWLRNLIITMSVLAVLILIGNLIIRFKGLTLVQGDFILYSYIVIFVYAMGYWGYKQGKIFVYSSKQIAETKKALKPQNSPKQSIPLSKPDEDFIEILKTIMISKKPYINNELNLYDLANFLNVSSSYLSYILNTCLDINFYQFVNKYRVEEAQRRIKNNDAQKFTLLTIAFESGFNSKASFNRIFKNITGLTPSEYQKSIVSTSTNKPLKRSSRQ